jgi:hypothetical protein
VTSLIQAIEASDLCILACWRGPGGRVLWGCTNREGEDWSRFCRYDTVASAVEAFLGRAISVTQFERDAIYTIQSQLQLNSHFVCEWVGSGKDDGWRRPFAVVDLPVPGMAIA